ncbi:MAG: heavy metal-associated domain-containing protein [Gemmatimonadaceae bacterium]|nr:heavy metal-associated domain-containing protein [Gemmatimonadaceae bacterium]
MTFKIQGMTCGGCVFGVRKVLRRLPGVSKAVVTYEESRAVVTYDPAMVTIAQMAAAIKTLGYNATVVASTAPK